MSTSGSYPLIRHDAQIAVGKETDHGTAVTPDRTLGKIVDAGDMPDPEVEWQEERNIDNRGRELSGKEPGRNTYDGGSLSVLPVDRYPFEVLFGQDGDDSATAGTYVVEVANDPLPRTMTVEAAYFGHDTDDDFVRTFAGNAVDTGTIQVDNESRLQVDLDFQAQGVTTGTSATDISGSEATGSVFMFHDADSFLTLNGTDYARVTDFEWELSNNLSPRWYIQPNDPEDPYEVHYGNAGHAITVTVEPTDDSLYADLIGRDDAGDASISFTNADGDTLAFEFRSVGLESSPYPFPDEGVPEVSASLIPDRGWVEYTPA